MMPSNVRAGRRDCWSKRTTLKIKRAGCFRPDGEGNQDRPSQLHWKIYEGGPAGGGTNPGGGGGAYSGGDGGAYPGGGPYGPHQFGTHPPYGPGCVRTGHGLYGPMHPPNESAAISKAKRLATRMLIETESPIPRTASARFLSRPNYENGPALNPKRFRPDRKGPAPIPPPRRIFSFCS
jgi:hypothetical protein